MLMSVASLLLLALPALGAWAWLVRRGVEWRVALGCAGLAWAAWAVAWTEMLSVGEQGRLTRGALLGAWGVPAAGGAGYLAQQRGWITAGLRDAREAWRGRLGRAERWAVVAIGVCVAVTGAVALIAAPNTWDSMVYHLTRVSVWSDLGQVAQYATHIDPQNYQPPGAELLILQGFVLSGGGDALAALVQWCAYVGVIALGSAAAGMLGAALRGQVLAALLLATMPLAILQATSTQNDLLLSYWVLLAMTLTAWVWRGAATDAGDRRVVAGAALATGLALGMAALTKGTGLMFGLPVGLLLAAACVRRMGWARSGALAVAACVLVALPSAGHWLRTNATYGSPIATTHAGIDNPYRVTDPSVGTLASNLVRNATNQLDMPVASWNGGIERAARGIVEAFGQDPDDPTTTFLGKPFKVGPFGPHEDHAGSALLLLLALVAGGVVLVRGGAGGLARGWLAVVVAQLLIFCTLITWQNWHVRLQLPMLIVMTVLIAVVVARWRRVSVAVAAITILAAPIYLGYNVNRPIVGSDSILTNNRTHVRFIPRPQLQKPFTEITHQLSIAGVTDVLVVSGVDDWQYPLHALGRSERPRVRFRDGLVGGVSGELADPASYDGIGAVLCMSCTEAQSQAIGAGGLRLSRRDEGVGRGDDATLVEIWMQPRGMWALPTAPLTDLTP